MRTANLHNQYGVRDTVGISKETLHIAFEEAFMLNCPVITIHEDSVHIATFVANNWSWGHDSFEQVWSI